MLSPPVVRDHPLLVRCVEGLLPIHAGVDESDGGIASNDPIASPEEPREVSKAHRQSVACSLEEYQRRHPDRDQAIAQVSASGASTMAEIGRHFGVYDMTVSHAVRKSEETRKSM
jgi:hypothetical protein